MSKKIKVIDFWELEECPYCSESNCAVQHKLNNGKNHITADCEPETYNRDFLREMYGE